MASIIKKSYRPLMCKLGMNNIRPLASNVEGWTFSVYDILLPYSLRVLSFISNKVLTGPYDSKFPSSRLIV
jgi:hypothetical protein